MPRAIDLLKQGRNEELWQMCCGFLKLNIREFMEIQERLLMEQLELLNNSAMGIKIMGGARPQTLEEFRRMAPLTTYKDYCPDLLNRVEDVLPAKPLRWSHTSGKSGEYSCKWIPMTPAYAMELSKVLYGVGILSGCSGWGDNTNIPEEVKILYSVAPAPYISGTFADLLRMQAHLKYLPAIEKAESLSFEERIKLGFQQAMSQGFDYFFGLSMILVNVGEKIRDSSDKINIRPFLRSPRALWRLGRGKIKSRIAGRQMLPKDLWKIKGIIGSGVDSLVYKDKIYELWGKRPLDLYSCTEGGIIATQAWDHSGMTLVPHLNFLEFIPQEEQEKLQMDRSYRPRTLLLNEVKAGESYEIVITNFHGGVLTRYRIGDLVKIISLRNDNLNINLPQRAFERRVDDIIDFFTVRFTERTIWQAIESTGMLYEDWMAYKNPGESTLNLLIEPKGNARVDKNEIANSIYKELMKSEDEKADLLDKEFVNSINFKVNVILLNQGSFARYTRQRQMEGADIAHLKPPRVNPPGKVLSLLVPDIEETIIVTRTKEPGKTAEVKQAAR
jgi:hypothetical protein